MASNELYWHVLLLKEHKYVVLNF